MSLVEHLRSLAAVVAEESAILSDPTRGGVPPTLVEAKLRLVGAVEAAVSGSPDWRAALSPDERAAAEPLLVALGPDMAANAELLRRRLDLCEDLMAAIGAEARRLTGGRSVTYGALGALARTDRAAPIAVNASL